MPEQKQINKKRVLSLFSGCGGMDLGFEGGFHVHKLSHPKPQKTFQKNNHFPDFIPLKATGFETVFANDIVPATKKIWAQYFTRSGKNPDIFTLKSIVDLVKQHHDGHRVFPENIDVVTGGFPCQDFSLAGKRKGFTSHKDHTGKIMDWTEASVETRGTLYMWMKEVIEITLPKVFIAENVKGLVNLSNVKDIIQHDFSTMENGGYHVFEPRVVQAADFGVPQSRERVIFMGVRKSCLLASILDLLEKDGLPADLSPYPWPTHAYTKKDKMLRPPVPVREVLRHLTEPNESDDSSQKHVSKAKFMGKHCQGQIEINLTGVAPTIRSEHHGNIEFRRLSPEHGGKYWEEFLQKGFTERRLTPRECALLQTFPPDFPLVIPGNGKRFDVSPSAAYKAVGNAVPPLLAYHLARRLEDIWSEYFG